MFGAGLVPYVIFDHVTGKAFTGPEFWDTGAKILCGKVKNDYVSPIHDEFGNIKQTLDFFPTTKLVMSMVHKKCNLHNCLLNKAEALAEAQGIPLEEARTSMRYCLLVASLSF